MSNTNQDANGGRSDQDELPLLSEIEDIDGDVQPVPNHFQMVVDGLGPLGVDWLAESRP